MTVNAARIFYSGQRSASWPQTTGTVSKAEVEPYKSSRGFDRSQAVVAYSYEVDGEKYRSDTIFFGQGPVDEAAARALVEKYKGPEVAVYYQPGQPENATLQPGVAWSEVSLWGVVGVLLCVVASGGLIGLRRAAE